MFLRIFFSGFKKSIILKNFFILFPKCKLRLATSNFKFLILFGSKFRGARFISFYTTELNKLDSKENVKPNKLEKYMSRGINNKLIFVDSFQFLSYLFDSLVKNLGRDNFKY